VEAASGIEIDDTVPRKIHGRSYTLADESAPEAARRQAAHGSSGPYPFVLN
jgi:hypothetical protein